MDSRGEGWGGARQGNCKNGWAPINLVGARLQCVWVAKQEVGATDDDSRS